MTGRNMRADTKLDDLCYCCLLAECQPTSKFCKVRKLGIQAKRLELRGKTPTPIQIDALSVLRNMGDGPRRGELA